VGLSEPGRHPRLANPDPPSHLLDAFFRDPPVVAANAGHRRTLLFDPQIGFGQSDRPPWEVATTLEQRRHDDSGQSEEAFRSEVRALLTARLAPRSTATGPLQVLGAGRDDVEAGRAFLSTLAEVGLATPGWPVELGGRAATRRQQTVIDEELRAFETADLYPFGVGIGLVGPTLLTHGTPEQQARWLPAMGRGAEIWCQLFSEPGAGSDLAALSTRAMSDGDGWRIDGQKVWSSRATYSRRGLLLTRTDPTVPKHSGITAFGLDMTSPGVDIRPMRQMNGDSHFSEVFLDGVVVPDTDRIGEVNGGWTVALTVLSHERAGIGAGGALRGGGGLRRTQMLAYLRSSGAGNDPVLRQRSADVIARLELQRLTGRRAQANARARGRPGPEGSGAKVRSSITTNLAADLALDLLGAEGMLAEGEWQTLFLTSPSLSIRGGTDEIQRNIVGERVLGLPPEPRVDKGVPFNETRRS
jgi:alkylation response protein AidB-like acyl-CoA dehydrogenase